MLAERKLLLWGDAERLGRGVRRGSRLGFWRAAQEAGGVTHDLMSDGGKALNGNGTRAEASKVAVLIAHRAVMRSANSSRSKTMMFSDGKDCAIWR